MYIINSSTLNPKPLSTSAGLLRHPGPGGRREANTVKLLEVPRKTQPGPPSPKPYL